MENDFHLSIKNHQRKIGDVRDLFRNLTNDEKQCLEREKILSEQKIYELRRKRDLEEQEKLVRKEVYKVQEPIQDFINKNKYNNRFSRNFENLGRKMSTENNNKLTSYEEQVIKTYGLLAQGTNEDFGKYLEDDDDNDYEIVNDKRENNNSNLHEESTDNKGVSKKKQRKLSKNKSNNNDRVDSSDSVAMEPKQPQQTEPHMTDMCGFYSIELPPKEKERLEKLKQQQSKGGLTGLKNKIKQLFTPDESYNLQKPPTYLEPLSNLDSEDGALPQRYAYYPRTIQDVQFGSSKIGFQAGQAYDEYYNQVDDLRQFDHDARVNNYKWRLNENVAILDDDLNVKITKSDKLDYKNKESKNNTGPTKKPSKFNRLTEAIISKAKSLRT